MRSLQKKQHARTSSACGGISYFTHALAEACGHMDKTAQFIFEKDGKRYLKFELAALKQPDNYGKTHTAYITTRETEAETPAAEEPKPKRKSRKKTEA